MWGSGSRLTPRLLCLPFLLLAASLPGWCSAADPAGMTDAEILTELSEIYGRQQERLAGAETTLESLLPMLEGSRTSLRELEAKSLTLSQDLRDLEKTIEGSASSLESSIGAMEKEVRRLRTDNAWLKAGVWSAFLATLGISLLYMAR